ncbi:MAG TPA: 6-phosphogluconolactonase [Thermohalobaculum sp.]|nr:6-phosphogluconolactonase [Thermohalobaculum sp.]
MSVNVVRHASAGEMATKLAAIVADRLAQAISDSGRAGLAVPGGSTPEAFLSDLGQAPIDWERVGVTLTDERWVPTSDPRSNQGMLARTLFRGAAAGAEFVPLYAGRAEPEDGVSAAARAIGQIVLPLDVVVLGMGEDMHTASLFPGSTGLAAALAGEAPVVVVRAPGAEEPRLTLSAPLLAGAAHRYLLIRGAAKLAALEKAAGLPPEEAPVRAILDAPGGVEVHWAP